MPIIHVIGRNVVDLENTSMRLELQKWNRVSPPSNLQNMPKPPTLSPFTSSNSKIHQAIMNLLPDGIQSIHPLKLQMDAGKWIPTPLIPSFLQHLNLLMIAITTAKNHWHNYMKMLGYGVLGSSNLFLLDAYQDTLDVDSNATMVGIAVGVPRKKSQCWTVSCDIKY